MAKRRFKRCGAKRRQGGGPCGQPAGWGTSHPGTGRCKLHGGASPNGEKAAAKEDTQYEEELHHSTVAQLYRTFKERTDPTSLLDELALLRALAVTYINRADVLEEALLRWNESFGKDFRDDWQERVVQLMQAQYDGDWESYHDLVARLPDPNAYMQRPRKVMDLSDARKLLTDISVVVDKIERHREAGAVPVKYLMDLLGDIADIAVGVARDTIEDPVERGAFLSRLETSWGRLQIGRRDDPGGQAGAAAIPHDVN